MSETVSIEPHLTARGGRWQREGTILRLPTGLNPRIQLNETAAELVLGCDGRETLEHLLNLSLAARNVPLMTTDQRYVRARREVDDLVRRLVSRGFLVPVDQ